MIEPHSAQEGASAWDVKVTWALSMPKLPSIARVAAAPFPLLFPLPLVCTGMAVARVSVELSLAGGGVGETASGAATAVAPLGGEAGLAAGELPLPELPALPAPAEPPRPKLSGCTEDSPADDRSTRPRVARSSGGRKREPSQRKM